MGSRMIRDRSKGGNKWLTALLFSVFAVGWCLAFSFKASATDPGASAVSLAKEQGPWVLLTRSERHEPHTRHKVTGKL